MKRLLSRLAICLTLLLLTGLPATAQGPQPFNTDQDLVLLNAELPGFGGMFYDDQGVLNVYMTESQLKRGVTQGDLAESFGEEIKILAGQYEFAQLHAWRESMNDLLSDPDVILLDVDERLNRIRVGVDRQAPRKASSLETRLSALQVPAAAVVFEEVDQIFQLAHTLSSAFNPVPGGVEINFPGFLCTLGFNIRFADGGPCYFMTNSHCTTVQGGVESTPYFQPAGGASIGTEIYDPVYFSGSPCPVGQVCRYSDSAAAIYNSPSLCEFGAIARTTGLGSVTIDHAQPRWQIVSKLLTPTVGMLVAKTGRTTGWSEGNVTATCVNVNVSGTNITQLCQSIVNATVGSGDSGSPVFRRRLDSSRAQLVGILWGGNGPGTQFIFSPMANIEAEVGGALPVF